MLGDNIKNILFVTAGIGVGATCLYKYYKNEPAIVQNTQTKNNIQIKQKNKQNKIALLGDVGGTNIRYQLVKINKDFARSTIIKQQKLKVSDFNTFQQTVDHFLKDAERIPQIIVIAIAGPVNNNSVLMSQVRRWGQLSGNMLKQRFECQQFVFINDFQANAYALLQLHEDDIVQINNVKPVDNQPKFIVGAGTGLGTATLISKQGIPPFVLPGQGGHRNFSPVNQNEYKYSMFFKEKAKKINIIDISQALFCGPAIPHIYEYQCTLHPQHQRPTGILTAEQIIQKGINEQNSIYRECVNQFISMYEHTVGNQILMKLPYGGVYLHGSITNTILPLILKKNNFLEEYKSERQYLKDVFDRIPIVFVKQIDLGLKGAYVYARKIQDSQ